jgi:hypothetical protein
VYHHSHHRHRLHHHRLHHQQIIPIQPATVVLLPGLMYGILLWFGLWILNEPSNHLHHPLTAATTTQMRTILLHQPWRYIIQGKNNWPSITINLWYYSVSLLAWWVLWWQFEKWIKVVWLKAVPW